MNCVHVQIDDFSVRLKPVPVEDQTLIRAGIDECLRSKDPRAPYYATYLLLKKSLDSVEFLEFKDGFNGHFVFGENSESELRILEIMHIKSPKFAKLALVCFQVMDGLRENFVDNNHNPMSGVKVIPHLSVVH